MAIKTTTSRNQSYWISDAAFSAIRVSKTISFWFKCPTVEATWGWNIVHWGQAGYPFEGGVNKRSEMFFRIIPGTDTSKMKLARYVYASSGGNSTPNATTNDINPDVWHHLVMVCTSTASLVYLDGALWTNAVQFPDVEMGAMFLGGGFIRVPSTTDSASISSGINSHITDLIAFDGQLTAQEVATLYANGSPSYSRNADPIAGIDNTILMRCPLICNLKNTAGNNVIATNFNEVFVDDSDLFDDWYDTDILTPQNRGVASKYLVGQSPGTLMLMSDSFGSISQIRLPLPLYNKLSMGEFGSIVTTTAVGGVGLLTLSTTGNTATVNTVDTNNNHQCEQQSTRTITASSWSNDVLTVTYSGPNLVVGQVARIGSSWYEVASFTPGSGLGASQTGAIITINTNSNPGSLVGQTIGSQCIIPVSSIREVYSNGTTPIFCTWTADDIFNQTSVPKLFSTGTVDRLTGDGDATATFTLYYRIASDPAIQVKGFKVQRGLPNGTFETVATVTGLDNPLLSGTIASVTITDVRQRNYAGTIGETDYRVRVVPTDTASDHQNRYLAFVNAEVTINGGSLRLCDFTEGSWTYAGLRGVPSNKGMSAFDVKNLIRAYASRNKQNVIAFNYDLDNYTETDILAYFNQIKTLWDSCFDDLGIKRPKYLCWGMYMHAAGGVSPSISLADWRARCMAYNLAQMKFAKQHPKDVEYISLYLASLGAWEMPCSGDLGVAQPGATFSNAGSYRIDPRHIPQRVFTQSATWDQATLTLTSSNLFQYLYVPNGSFARIYVARTSLAGTAVVDDWYTIVSATNSTVTLASSITGGAAGVGADVTVYAVATQVNSLHLAGFLPSVYAEMLTNEIIKSVVVAGGIQKQYWDLANLPVGVGS